jgi:3-methyladenine DNA glycosylase AlkD
MTPKILANRAISILKKSGNPKDAAGARAYFKEYDQVYFYGVKSPLQQKIERELYSLVKGHWDVSDAFQFCSLLIRHKFHECKNVGILLLSRYHRNFPKTSFQEADEWLSDNYCGSWALVDALCPLILTPSLLKYPGELARLKRWSKSKNLWLRRASVVTLIPLARHGEFLNTSYQFVMNLSKDEEDLIHKATGWLLREAGKTDPARLQQFLLTKGTCLPRTTVRYAIERFPKQTQQRLLKATRPKNRTQHSRRTKRTKRQVNRRIS